MDAYVSDEALEKRRADRQRGKDRADRLLIKYKLIKKECGGGGDCLFHVGAYFIYKNKRMHYQLREETVSWIRDHHEHLLYGGVPLVEAFQNGIGPRIYDSKMGHDEIINNLPDYCTHMRKPGSYADVNVELQAIANMKHCNFLVISDDAGQELPITSSTPSSITYPIFHQSNPEHFLALLPSPSSPSSSSILSSSASPSPSAFLSHPPVIVDKNSCSAADILKLFQTSMVHQSASSILPSKHIKSRTSTELEESPTRLAKRSKTINEMSEEPKFHVKCRNCTLIFYGETKKDVNSQRSRHSTTLGKCLQAPLGSTKRSRINPSNLLTTQSSTHVDVEMNDQGLADCDDAFNDQDAAMDLTNEVLDHVSNVTSSDSDIEDGVNNEVEAEQENKVDARSVALKYERVLHI
jgi:hypothetical protein